MPDLTALPMPDRHRELLSWFAERTGKVVPWPKPLADGSFLVSAPKGIYKPRAQRYVLSVRIAQTSGYDDGRVVEREDGTWALAYHQENPEPKDRDLAPTNVAMMRSMKDAIPVGVLKQVDPEAGSSRYLVVGIARVVAWRDGYFYLEGLGPDGFHPHADTVTDVVTGLAEDEQDDGSEAEAPPTDEYDARRRVTRQIVARRGQKKFRMALIQAYGGRCAVTGSAVEAVLEAAHLRPYMGPASNVVTNGLLLRADIHTLLDLRLLAIDPSTRTVRLAETLRQSDYASLEGRQVAAPTPQSARPDLDVLTQAWDAFTAEERLRGSAAPLAASVSTPQP
jgi:putative restriction endonuclease